MNTLLQYACYSVILVMGTCQQPATSESPEILNYFQKHTLPDTLHVAVAVDADSPPKGDSIPNRLFFSAIPRDLLASIDYIADSSQALVIGRQQFPLDDNFTACLVEIRQFWFQHHSLLVYNKKLQKFTDRITLAAWYGGDGGQQLIGSWLFDYDGDGFRDILRREIQHSMVPVDEGLEERTEQSAALFLWRNGIFVEGPLADTADIMERYPIRSFFE